MAMMAVVGGKLSWLPPPSLKTSLVSARYACKDKARAKMPHEGSRPVAPLINHFGGNLVQVLGPYGWELLDTRGSYP